MTKRAQVLGVFVLVVAVLVICPSVASPEVDYPGALWTAANSSNFTVGDREADGLSIRWIVIHDVEGDAAACLSWF